MADPSGLGGLQSYRCNEFGHLCNGAPPPHLAPGTNLTLTGCASSEGMSPGPQGSAPDPLHQLITVEAFTNFLKSLKDDPGKVFVSALAGPPTPYIVAPTMIPLANGGTDSQPSIAHSCSQNSGEFADPGVRIRDWLDAFGFRGVFETICAADFAPGLTAIATAIAKNLTAHCVNGPVASKADGTPDCKVDQTTQSQTTAALTTVPLPLCDATRSVVPCWQLQPDPVFCGTGRRFDVCHDTACAPVVSSTTSNVINVSCSLVVP